MSELIPYTIQFFKNFLNEKEGFEGEDDYAIDCAQLDNIHDCNKMILELFKASDEKLAAIDKVIEEAYNCQHE